jgi:hypothetical protein
MTDPRHVRRLARLDSLVDCAGSGTQDYTYEEAVDR